MTLSRKHLIGGIKRNTLLSAKKKLGIVSGKGKQEDGTAFWTWIMPEKRV